MRTSRFLPPLVLALLLAFNLCYADVVTAPAAPSPMSGGTVASAADWNNTMVAAVTWMNNQVVAALNVLTTKGDVYAYTGSALARVPIGTNGQILVADSAQAAGMAWKTFTGSAPLTTKGDVMVYSGTAINRLGVGSNAQALVARSSATNGVQWESLSGDTYPAGACIPFTPAYGGSIPAGYSLCDGTGGTPNLIGLFVLGTRPNGSSATPASGGFGGQAVDARGTGVATHSNVITIPGQTTNTPSASAFVDISVAAVGTAGYSHVHSTTDTGVTSATASNEPSDYALVYIMKL